MNAPTTLLASPVFQAVRRLARKLVDGSSCFTKKGSSYDNLSTDNFALGSSERSRWGP